MTEAIKIQTTAGDPFAFAGRNSVSTREQRALAFWRERGGEVTRMADAIYRVPSFSQDGVEYIVDYEAETCTCPSASYHPSIPCQHQLLVDVINAKRRGQKRRNFIAAVAAEEE